MEGFLDTIGEYMEVHSTFHGDVSKIPNHIVNHGECILFHVTVTPSPMMIACRCAFSTRSKIVREYSVLIHVVFINCVW